MLRHKAAKTKTLSPHGIRLKQGLGIWNVEDEKLAHGRLTHWFRLRHRVLLSGTALLEGWLLTLRAQAVDSADAELRIQAVVLDSVRRVPSCWLCIALPAATNT